MKQILAFFDGARTTARRPVPTPLAVAAGLAVILGGAIVSRWLSEREDDYLARGVRLAALAAEVAQAEADAAEADELAATGRRWLRKNGLPVRTPGAEYPGPDDLDPLGRGEQLRVDEAEMDRE